jgi:multidrug efflux pump subunit AcrB
VAFGIPVSVLGALWLMPGMDLSLNMISMVAFIMVMGILVDDSIVISESINQRQEHGEPGEVGAINGACEVARPVVFGVITTITAFLPMIFIGGVFGKFMGQIPWVVVCCLVLSLVESVFFLPARLAAQRWRPEARSSLLARLQNQVNRGLSAAIVRGYVPLLSFVLRHRHLTLVAFLLMIMGAVAAIGSGIVRFVFFPSVEAEAVIANLEMPVGTPAAVTDAVLRRLEAAADGLRGPDGKPAAAQVLTLLAGSTGGNNLIAASGGDQGNIGEVRVSLADAQRRNLSAVQLVEDWRRAVGELPGVRSLEFQAEMGRSSNQAEISLSSVDTQGLMRAAEATRDRLRHLPGVANIRLSSAPGKIELDLTLSVRGRSLGLSAVDLARQVRAAYYGLEVQRIQQDRDEVRVMLRLPEADRRDLASLAALRVRLPGGGEASLGDVAVLTEGRSPTQLERRDRRQSVALTVQFARILPNGTAPPGTPPPAGEAEVMAMLERDIVPALRREVADLAWTAEGITRDNLVGIGDLRRNFAIVLFAIYGLVAVGLRSFLQPLVIMAAVPFGIIGAVLGHLLMNLPMSMLSLFGVVAMTGVVVNQGLVKVDVVNRLRELEGMTTWEAVTTGAPRRFRAIMLTTATTFLSLVPLMLQTSVQARFLVPMAVSIAFGEVFATAITLILIPCLYMMLDDIVSWWQGHPPAVQATGAAPP